MRAARPICAHCLGEGASAVERKAQRVGYCSILTRPEALTVPSATARACRFFGGPGAEDEQAAEV